MNPKINQNIKSWWSKLPDILRGRFPTFIHELNPKAEVLFVGLNPAGSFESPPKVIEDLTNKKIEEIIKEEKKLIGFWDSSELYYKRYYKVFHYFRKEIGVICEYVDIFQVRGANSTGLINLMSSIKKGEPEFFEVHTNHLANFELIIQELPNLKFVLLNNVNSSNLVKNHYGAKMKFDHKTGLYKITQPKDIYFYLQGSMQYGRSTDYDKERIIWFFNQIR